MESPLRVGDRIAELIGASPGEVLVADTHVRRTVPAHDVRCCGRVPQRRVIVTERSNFPTDLYIARRCRRPARLRGARGRARGHRGGAGRRHRAADAHRTSTSAPASATTWRALTEAAHAAGALVLWDLSHSAGAVEIQLQRDRRRPRGGMRLQVSERRARLPRVSVRRHRAAGRTCAIRSRDGSATTTRSCSTPSTGAHRASAAG